MNRVAERVGRNLQQIAERATPSPTAWPTIRSRIEEQADEPDVEVLIMNPNDNEGPRRTRATLSVVAAAAVVLITIGIIVWTGSESDTGGPVATGDAQEAIDLARRFVEARDAWDGEAARALVTDDAVVDDLAVAQPDDYLLFHEFDRATGWRYMQPDCTATDLGPPIEVTCTYMMQNAWSQAIGVGPFTGSNFKFVIADGQIQQVRNNFDWSVFDPTVFTIFDQWLVDTYPDDVDLMWDSGLSRLTPEAFDLFRRHTAEFVAVQTGVNFVEGRDRWDGEAVRTLVADNAVIDDLAVSNAADYLLFAEFDRTTGLRYLEPNCTATVPEPPFTVTCTFTVTNAWSQAIGVGPFAGSSFEFVIDNGQIQRITHHFDSSQFEPQVVDVFREWLADAYPDDVDVMWDSTTGKALLTPEAIELFEQRTTEFVGSLQ